MVDERAIHEMFESIGSLWDTVKGLGERVDELGLNERINELSNKVDLISDQVQGLFQIIQGMTAVGKGRHENSPFDQQSNLQEGPRAPETIGVTLRIRGLLDIDLYQELNKAIAMRSGSKEFSTRAWLGRVAASKDTHLIEIDVERASVNLGSYLGGP